MDSPHVQYRVLDQVKSMEPDERGGYHHVFTVHYETPSGVRSSVQIPATHHTARNVHDAIMDEMQHIEAVAALQPNAPVPEYPPS